MRFHDADEREKNAALSADDASGAQNAPRGWVLTEKAPDAAHSGGGEPPDGTQAPPDAGRGAAVPAAEPVLRTRPWQRVTAAALSVLLAVTMFDVRGVTPAFADPAGAPPGQTESHAAADNEMQGVEGGAFEPESETTDSGSSAAPESSEGDATQDAGAGSSAVEAYEAPLPAETSILRVPSAASGEPRDSISIPDFSDSGTGEENGLASYVRPNIQVGGCGDPITDDGKTYLVRSGEEGAKMLTFEVRPTFTSGYLGSKDKPVVMKIQIPYLYVDEYGNFQTTYEKSEWEQYTAGLGEDQLMALELSVNNYNDAGWQYFDAEGNQLDTDALAAVSGTLYAQYTGLKGDFEFGPGSASPRFDFAYRGPVPENAGATVRMGLLVESYTDSSGNVTSGRYAFDTGSSKDESLDPTNRAIHSATLINSNLRWEPTIEPIYEPALWAQYNYQVFQISIENTSDDEASRIDSVEFSFQDVLDSTGGGRNGLRDKDLRTWLYVEGERPEYNLDDNGNIAGGGATDSRYIGVPGQGGALIYDVTSVAEDAGDTDWAAGVDWDLQTGLESYETMPYGCASDSMVNISLPRELGKGERITLAIALPYAPIFDAEQNPEDGSWFYTPGPVISVGPTVHFGNNYSWTQTRVYSPHFKVPETGFSFSKLAKGLGSNALGERESGALGVLNSYVINDVQTSVNVPAFGPDDVPLPDSPGADEPQRGPTIVDTLPEGFDLESVEISLGGDDALADWFDADSTGPIVQFELKDGDVGDPYWVGAPNDLVAENDTAFAVRAHEADGDGEPDSGEQGGLLGLVEQQAQADGHENAAATGGIRVVFKNGLPADAKMDGSITVSGVPRDPRNEYENTAAYEYGQRTWQASTMEEDRENWKVVPYDNHDNPDTATLEMAKAEPEVFARAFSVDPATKDSEEGEKVQAPLNESNISGWRFYLSNDSVSNIAPAKFSTGTLPQRYDSASGGFVGFRADAVSLSAALLTHSQPSEVRFYTWQRSDDGTVSESEPVTVKPGESGWPVVDSTDGSLTFGSSAWGGGYLSHVEVSFASFGAQVKSRTEALQNDPAMEKCPYVEILGTPTNVQDIELEGAFATDYAGAPDGWDKEDSDSATLEISTIRPKLTAEAFWKDVNEEPKKAEMPDSLVPYRWGEGEGEDAWFEYVLSNEASSAALNTHLDVCFDDVVPIEESEDASHMHGFATDEIFIHGFDVELDGDGAGMHAILTDDGRLQHPAGEVASIELYKAGKTPGVDEPDSTIDANALASMVKADGTLRLDVLSYGFNLADNKLAAVRVNIPFFRAHAEEGYEALRLEAHGIAAEHGADGAYDPTPDRPNNGDSYAYTYLTGSASFAPESELYGEDAKKEASAEMPIDTVNPKVEALAFWDVPGEEKPILAVPNKEDNVGYRFTVSNDALSRSDKTDVAFDIQSVGDKAGENALSTHVAGFKTDQIELGNALSAGALEKGCALELTFLKDGEAVSSAVEETVALSLDELGGYAQSEGAPQDGLLVIDFSSDGWKNAHPELEGAYLKRAVLHYASFERSVADDGALAARFTGESDWFNSVDDSEKLAAVGTFVQVQDWTCSTDIDASAVASLDVARPGLGVHTHVQYGDVAEVTEIATADKASDLDGTLVPVPYDRNMQAWVAFENDAFDSKEITASGDGEGGDQTIAHDADSVLDDADASIEVPLKYERGIEQKSGGTVDAVTGFHTTKLTVAGGLMRAFAQVGEIRLYDLSAPEGSGGNAGDPDGEEGEGEGGGNAEPQPQLKATLKPNNGGVVSNGALQFGAFEVEMADGTSFESIGLGENDNLVIDEDTLERLGIRNLARVELHSWKGMEASAAGEGLRILFDGFMDADFGSENYLRARTENHLDCLRQPDVPAGDDYTVGRQDYSVVYVSKMFFDASSRAALKDGGNPEWRFDHWSTPADSGHFDDTQRQDSNSMGKYNTVHNPAEWNQTLEAGYKAQGSYLFDFRQYLNGWNEPTEGACHIEQQYVRNGLFVGLGAQPYNTAFNADFTQAFDDDYFDAYYIYIRKEALEYGTLNSVTVRYSDGTGWTVDGEELAAAIDNLAEGEEGLRINLLGGADDAFADDESLYYRDAFDDYTDTVGVGEDGGLEYVKPERVVESVTYNVDVNAAQYGADGKVAAPVFGTDYQYNSSGDNPWNAPYNAGGNAGVDSAAKAYFEVEGRFIKSDGYKDDLANCTTSVSMAVGGDNARDEANGRMDGREAVERVCDADTNSEDGKSEWSFKDYRLDDQRHLQYINYASSHSFYKAGHIDSTAKVDVVNDGAYTGKGVHGDIVNDYDNDKKGTESVDHDDEVPFGSEQSYAVSFYRNHGSREIGSSFKNGIDNSTEEATPYAYLRDDWVGNVSFADKAVLTDDMPECFPYEALGYYGFLSYGFAVEADLAAYATNVDFEIAVKNDQGEASGGKTVRFELEGENKNSATASEFYYAAPGEGKAQKLRIAKDDKIYFWFKHDGDDMPGFLQKAINDGEIVDDDINVVDLGQNAFVQSYDIVLKRLGGSADMSNELPDESKYAAEFSDGLKTVDVTVYGAPYVYVDQIHPVHNVNTSVEDATNTSEVRAYEQTDLMTGIETDGWDYYNDHNNGTLSDDVYHSWQDKAYMRGYLIPFEVGQTITQPTNNSGESHIYDYANNNLTPTSGAFEVRFWNRPNGLTEATRSARVSAATIKSTMDEDYRLRTLYIPAEFVDKSVRSDNGVYGDWFRVTGVRFDSDDPDNGSEPVEFTLKELARGNFLSSAAIDVNGVPCYAVDVEEMMRPGKPLADFVDTYGMLGSTNTLKGEWEDVEYAKAFVDSVYVTYEAVHVNQAQPVNTEYGNVLEAGWYLAPKDDEDGPTESSGFAFSYEGVYADRTRADFESNAAWDGDSTPSFGKLADGYAQGEEKENTLQELSHEADTESWVETVDPNHEELGQCVGTDLDHAYWLTNLVGTMELNVRRGANWSSLGESGAPRFFAFDADSKGVMRNFTDASEGEGVDTADGEEPTAAEIANDIFDAERSDIPNGDVFAGDYIEYWIDLGASEESNLPLEHTDFRFTVPQGQRIVGWEEIANDTGHALKAWLGDESFSGDKDKDSVALPGVDYTVDPVWVLPAEQADLQAAEPPAGLSGGSVAAQDAPLYEVEFPSDEAGQPAGTAVPPEGEPMETEVVRTERYEDNRTLVWQVGALDSSPGATRIEKGQHVLVRVVTQMTGELEDDENYQDEQNAAFEENGPSYSGKVLEASVTAQAHPKHGYTQYHVYDEDCDKGEHGDSDYATGEVGSAGREKNMHDRWQDNAGNKKEAGDSVYDIEYCRGIVDADADGLTKQYGADVRSKVKFYDQQDHRTLEVKSAFTDPWEGPTSGDEAVDVGNAFKSNDGDPMQVTVGGIVNTTRHAADMAVTVKFTDEAGLQVFELKKAPRTIGEDGVVTESAPGYPDGLWPFTGKRPLADMLGTGNVREDGEIVSDRESVKVEYFDKTMGDAGEDGQTPGAWVSEADLEGKYGSAAGEESDAGHYVNEGIFRNVTQVRWTYYDLPATLDGERDLALDDVALVGVGLYQDVRGGKAVEQEDVYVGKITADAGYVHYHEEDTYTRFADPALFDEDGNISYADGTKVNRETMELVSPDPDEQLAVEALPPAGGDAVQGGGEPAAPAVDAPAGADGGAAQDAAPSDAGAGASGQQSPAAGPAGAVPSGPAQAGGGAVPGSGSSGTGEQAGSGGAPSGDAPAGADPANGLPAGDGAETIGDVEPLEEEEVPPAQPVVHHDEFIVKQDQGFVDARAVVREAPNMQFQAQVFQTKEQAAAPYDPDAAQKQGYVPGESFWYKSTLRNRFKGSNVVTIDGDGVDDTYNTTTGTRASDLHGTTEEENLNSSGIAENDKGSAAPGEELGLEGPLFNPVVYEKIPTKYVDPKGLTANNGVTVKWTDKDGEDVLSERLKGVQVKVEEFGEAIKAPDYGGEMTYRSDWKTFKADYSTSSVKPFNDLDPREENVSATTEFQMYRISFEGGSEEHPVAMEPGDMIEVWFEVEAKTDDLPQVYTLLDEELSSGQKEPAYFPRVGEYFVGGHEPGGYNWDDFVVSPLSDWSSSNANVPSDGFGVTNVNWSEADGGFRKVSNGSDLMDMDSLMRDAAMSGDRSEKSDVWEMFDGASTYIPGSSVNAQDTAYYTNRSGGDPDNASYGWRGNDRVFIDEDSKTARTHQRVRYTPDPDGALSVSDAPLYRADGLPEKAAYMTRDVDTKREPAKGNVLETIRRNQGDRWETNQEAGGWADAYVRDFYTFVTEPRTLGSGDNANWAELIHSETPLLWSENRVHLQAAWLATSSRFTAADTESESPDYKATRHYEDLYDPNTTWRYTGQGDYSSDPENNAAAYNRYIMKGLLYGEYATALEYNEDFDATLTAYNYGDRTLDGVEFTYILPRGVEPKNGNTLKVGATVPPGDLSITAEVLSSVGAPTGFADTPQANETFEDIDPSKIEIEVLQTPTSEYAGYDAPSESQDPAQYYGQKAKYRGGELVDGEAEENDLSADPNRSTYVSEKASEGAGTRAYQESSQPWAFKITVKQELGKWFGRNVDGTPVPDAGGDGLQGAEGENDDAELPNQADVDGYYGDAGYQIRVVFPLHVFGNNENGWWYDRVMTQPWDDPGNSEPSPASSYYRIYDIDHFEGQNADESTIANYQAGGMDWMGGLATNEGSNYAWDGGVSAAYFLSYGSPNMPSIDGYTVQNNEFVVPSGAGGEGSAMGAALENRADANYGEAQKNGVRLAAVTGTRAVQREPYVRTWATVGEGAAMTSIDEYYLEAEGDATQLNVHVENQYWWDRTAHDGNWWGSFSVTGSHPMSPAEFYDRRIHNYAMDGGQKGALILPVVTVVLPEGIAPLNSNGSLVATDGRSYEFNSWGVNTNENSATEYENNPDEYFAANDDDVKALYQGTVTYQTFEGDAASDVDDGDEPADEPTGRYVVRFEPRADYTDDDAALEARIESGDMNTFKFDVTTVGEPSGDGNAAVYDNVYTFVSSKMQGYKFLSDADFADKTDGRGSAYKWKVNDPFAPYYAEEKPGSANYDDRIDAVEKDVTMYTGSRLSGGGWATERVTGGVLPDNLVADDSYITKVRGDKASSADSEGALNRLAGYGGVYTERNGFDFRSSLMQSLALANGTEQQGTVALPDDPLGINDAALRVEEPSASPADEAATGAGEGVLGGTSSSGGADASGGNGPVLQDGEGADPNAGQGAAADDGRNRGRDGSEAASPANELPDGSGPADGTVPSGDGADGDEETDGASDRETEGTEGETEPMDSDLVAIKLLANMVELFADEELPGPGVLDLQDYEGLPVVDFADKSNGGTYLGRALNGLASYDGESGHPGFEYPQKPGECGDNPLVQFDEPFVSRAPSADGKAATHVDAGVYHALKLRATYPCLSSDITVIPDEAVQAELEGGGESEIESGAGEGQFVNSEGQIGFEDDPFQYDDAVWYAARVANSPLNDEGKPDESQYARKGSVSHAKTVFAIDLPEQVSLYDERRLTDETYAESGQIYVKWTHVLREARTLEDGTELPAGKTVTDVLSSQALADQGWTVHFRRQADWGADDYTQDGYALPDRDGDAGAAPERDDVKPKSHGGEKVVIELAPPSDETEQEYKQFNSLIAAAHTGVRADGYLGSGDSIELRIKTRIDNLEDEEAAEDGSREGTWDAGTTRLHVTFDATNGAWIRNDEWTENMVGEDGSMVVKDMDDPNRAWDHLGDADASKPVFEDGSEILFNQRFAGQDSARFAWMERDEDAEAYVDEATGETVPAADWDDDEDLADVYTADESGYFKVMRPDADVRIDTYKLRDSTFTPGVGAGSEDAHVQSQLLSQFMLTKAENKGGAVNSFVVDWQVPCRGTYNATGTDAPEDGVPLVLDVESVRTGQWEIPGSAPEGDEEAKAKAEYEKGLRVYVLVRTAARDDGGFSLPGTAADRAAMGLSGGDASWELAGDPKGYPVRNENGSKDNRRIDLSEIAGEGKAVRQVRWVVRAPGTDAQGEALEMRATPEGDVSPKVPALLEDSASHDAPVPQGFRLDVDFDATKEGKQDADEEDPYGFNTGWGGEVGTAVDDESLDLDVWTDDESLDKADAGSLGTDQLGTAAGITATTSTQTIETANVHLNHFASAVPRYDDTKYLQADRARAGMFVDRERASLQIELEQLYFQGNYNSGWEWVSNGTVNTEASRMVKYRIKVHNMTQKEIEDDRTIEDGVVASACSNPNISAMLPTVQALDPEILEYVPREQYADDTRNPLNDGYKGVGSNLDAQNPLWSYWVETPEDQDESSRPLCIPDTEYHADNLGNVRSEFGVNYETGSRRRYLSFHFSGTGQDESTQYGSLQPGEDLYVEFMMPISASADGSISSDLLAFTGYAGVETGFRGVTPQVQDSGRFTAYGVDYDDANINNVSIEMLLSQRLNFMGFAERSALGQSKYVVSDYDMVTREYADGAAPVVEGGSYSYAARAKGRSSSAGAVYPDNGVVLFDILPDEGDSEVYNYAGEQGAVTRRPRESEWNGWIDDLGSIRVVYNNRQDHHPDDSSLEWVEVTRDLKEEKDEVDIWVGPFRKSDDGSIEAVEDPYYKELPLLYRSNDDDGRAQWIAERYENTDTLRASGFVRLSELKSYVEELEASDPDAAESLVHAVRAIWANVDENTRLPNFGYLELAYDMKAPLNLPKYLGEFDASAGSAAGNAALADRLAATSQWNTFAQRVMTSETASDIMETGRAGAYVTAPDGRGYIGDYVWIDQNWNGEQDDLADGASYETAPNGRPLINTEEGKDVSDKFKDVDYDGEPEDPGVNGVFVELLNESGQPVNRDGEAVVWDAGFGPNHEGGWVLADANGEPVLGPDGNYRPSTAGGAVSCETQTDYYGNHGYYILPDLAPGDYKLRFTFPAEYGAYSLTTKEIGPDGGKVGMDFERTENADGTSTLVATTSEVFRVDEVDYNEGKFASDSLVTGNEEYDARMTS